MTSLNWDVYSQLIGKLFSKAPLFRPIQMCKTQYFSWKWACAVSYTLTSIYRALLKLYTHFPMFVFSYCDASCASFRICYTMVQSCNNFLIHYWYINNPPFGNRRRHQRILTLYCDANCQQLHYVLLTNQNLNQFINTYAALFNGPINSCKLPSLWRWNCLASFCLTSSKISLLLLRLLNSVCLHVHVVSLPGSVSPKQWSLIKKPVNVKSPYFHCLIKLLPRVPRIISSERTLTMFLVVIFRHSSDVFVLGSCDIIPICYNHIVQHEGGTLQTFTLLLSALPERLYAQ